MTFNWRNRTLWTGDNLDVMRGMNSESVDLIYLDPPFNSNTDYSAPIGSEAAGAAFKDTWTLSDVDEAWHGEIADRQPALYAIIDAADLAHGKGMKSYLMRIAAFYSRSATSPSTMSSLAPKAGAITSTTFNCSAGPETP